MPIHVRDTILVGITTNALRPPYDWHTVDVLPLMIKPLLYVLVAGAACMLKRCINITDVPRLYAIPDANGGLKARQLASILRANNTERIGMHRKCQRKKCSDSMQ